MGFEIDFLAVGEGESGGDAVALRYGDLSGPRFSQTVIVIDGGYVESGEKLVEHIGSYYGTDQVDIVVSSHPDRDHIGGLSVVLENLDVTNLLMHLPWNHSDSVAKGLRSGFGTLAVNEKLEKSLSNAAELHDIAKRKGINVIEPFAGVSTQDGSFRIIGPTEAFYEELLPQVSSPISPLQKLASLLDTAKEAERSVLVSETLVHETLRDDGTTTANNNTSVISVLMVDGHSCLLTADAGIPALEQAAGTLEAEGFVAGSLRFVQVPHHGSRRNVGPSVLNRLLGPKGQASRGYAFVSAPPDNPEQKHPAKKVTNAFLRRGYPVHATQGSLKWHNVNAPSRPTFIASQPLPFHNQVEEDSEA